MRAVPSDRGELMVTSVIGGLEDPLQELAARVASRAGQRSRLSKRICPWPGKLIAISIGMPYFRRSNLHAVRPSRAARVRHEAPPEEPRLAVPQGSDRARQLLSMSSFRPEGVLNVVKKRSNRLMLLRGARTRV